MRELLSRTKIAVFVPAPDPNPKVVHVPSSDKGYIVDCSGTAVEEDVDEFGHLLYEMWSASSTPPPPEAGIWIFEGFASRVHKGGVEEEWSENIYSGAWRRPYVGEVKAIVEGRLPMWPRAGAEPGPEWFEEREVPDGGAVQEAGGSGDLGPNAEGADEGHDA